MAASHGKNARVYAGGYNLSGYLNSASSQATVDMADATVFTSTDKEFVPGVGDGKFAAEGLFFGAAGEVDAVMAAAIGDTGVIITHLPTGDAIGERGRAISASLAKYDVQTPVDGVNAVTVDAQSAVGAESVIVHRALATATGGGTATTVDGAAASSGGGVGYIQCTALTGGTAAVVIQHSADDISYVDLITFTNITSANQAERVAATGTVNRYTRAVWTVTGGTATIHTAFGRK